MRPPIEGLVPLLQVYDMPRSLAFYRDTLGFGIVTTSDPRRGDDVDWVLLRRDGCDLMLNTAYERDLRPAEPPRDRFAAHADTGLFFGCRDLDGVYSHLSAHGVRVEPPSVAPYGMRQLWLKDPDGYELCFQWPVA